MHRSHGFMAIDHPENEVPIADVPLFERTPLHEVAMTCVEVVHDDREIARPMKMLAAMASHIASAAGHENRGHDLILLLTGRTT